ncbi:MAG: hypothetical protein MRY21_00405 [Simkaniaceae bacterium]|nr:hypothetical protein [Simkaniaceae bacterium]
MDIDQEKTKLCFHCEGSVPFDADSCIYCGNSLVQTSESPFQFTEPAEQSYAPPYATQEPQEEQAASFEEPIQAESVRFIPLVMFIFGTFLALLATGLFLFGSGGALILKFNATLWPMWALFAVPLIYFGHRFLD